MAKEQQSQATNLADDISKQSKVQLGQSLTGGGAFGPGGLGGDYAAAKTKGDQTFDAAKSGFTQQQTTGGYDPAQLSVIRQNSSDLAATGGYDPETLSKLRAGYTQAETTGGYDPTQLAYLRSKGAEFVDTGGYDPAAFNTYKDFATTGGFSDQDKTNYLNRATGGVKNTYDQLMQQQRNKASATGGLGGGGEYSQMARQLAQAQADATLGGQTDLQSQIAKNKLSGAGGLGDIATGRRQTLQGLGTMEGQVAEGTRGALAGQTTLETGVATGRRAGAQQQEDIEANVAHGVQGANTGLASLYNTQTGQITDMGKMMLTAMGIDWTNQAEAANVLQKLSTNPGAYDTVLRTITAVKPGYSGGALGGATIGGGG